MPEPFSGWFDLLRNDWVYETHPAVDRVEEQLAVMQWKLNQLLERQAGIANTGIALAAKQLQVELACLAEAV